MFFQISPVRRERKQKVAIKAKSPEKIEILSFGPFSGNPKLFFDGVKIGDSASCKLLIKNDTKQDMTIVLSKRVPEELHVQYNWDYHDIQKNCEVIFEITWTPTEKVAACHKLTFENYTRTICKVVPLTFKTATPSPKKLKSDETKTSLGIRKPPTKTYYPVKPSRISPKKYPPSPTKQSGYNQPPLSTYNTNKNDFLHQNQCYTKREMNVEGNVRNKENVPTSGNGTESDKKMFKSDYFNTAERNRTLDFRPEHLDTFNDSLESNEPADLSRTFALHPESLGTFNDSLNTNKPTYLLTPVKQKEPPLTSYNSNTLTPDISLGSYFRQKTERTDTPNFGFEYKLQVQSFCFTPTESPCEQNEELSLGRNCKTECNRLKQDANFNTATYTTNLDAHINDNTSFETYILGNSSGGTYTKDSPIGHFENLTPVYLRIPPNIGKRSTPINEITPTLYDYVAENSNLRNTDYFIEKSQINISDISSITNNERYDIDATTNSHILVEKPQRNIFQSTYDQSLIQLEKTGNQFISTRPQHFLPPTTEINNKNNFISINESNRRLTDVESTNNNITHSAVPFLNRKLSSIKEESIIDSNVHTGVRKKSDLDCTVNHSKVGGGLSGPKGWSKKGSAVYRIAKNTSGLNLKRFITSDSCKEQEPVSKISKMDTNTVIIQNPFLFVGAETVDPFSTPQYTHCVDDKWIEQQELYFIKWLNCLLAAPRELYSEEKVIDVAKVWQECKKREVEAVPTREELSNKYHVNAKLNSLRKSASNFYRSSEIKDVLSKVILAITNGKLSIRRDKDVHLNISIKSDIMSLLLSYNPLWLRIGLETIYNETIPLHSNSDVVGLSTFLINKLFKSSQLLKKHKSIHSPKYAADFNKFFLKKFFILVYFLDQAKNKKLIPHDPCLFCKNGTVKESRELLITLARELLSAVGDITKFLKFSGYIVTHVQTYIHEFDYVVTNLSVDLRDGVRLTKIMELILLKEDLTRNLRLPAISRLQKIHNMKVVFNSLENAGYKILYDISPKDIVDGHREKTLSFLWQIIYKFEAPLMAKCASTIQVWFRSLPVIIERKILQRARLRKENAAKKIQNWYRSQKLSRKLIEYAKALKLYAQQRKIETAVVKIQTYYRMYRQKCIYRKQIASIKGVQRFSRGWLIRNYYKQRIKSAILLQSWARMFIASNKYMKIKEAVKRIEVWYISNKQTRLALVNYQKLKSATMYIQQEWRRNCLAKEQKKQYVKLKQTVLSVQRRFRANRLGRKEKIKYEKIKSSTQYIQVWYRSIKVMTVYRQTFLNLKRAVQVIEVRYASILIMRKERESYRIRKNSCIKIQQYYRAYKCMVRARIHYTVLRRTTIHVQQRFRAKQLMIQHVASYELLKKSIICVQRRFRAKKAMVSTRKEFLNMQEATIKIQVWYRATVKMHKCKSYYLSLRQSIRLIEEKWSAKIIMRKQLLEYQRMRNAAIKIQRHYRAFVAMRSCQNNYTQLRSATCFIQAKFRANKVTKLQKEYYLNLKKATLILQTRYRAKQEMLQCRKRFETLKNATVKIQGHFRANQLMKKTRIEYQLIIKYSIIVQRSFRAKQLMLTCRENYRKLKKTTELIQGRWRARKLGQEQRRMYHNLRNASIIIQQKWKATKLANETLHRYQTLRKSTIFIQRKWRAKQLCRKTRKQYLKTKTATVTIQAYWRARKLRKLEYEKFERLKNAALTIQRKLRATLRSKIEKKKFECTKKAVVTIQVWWKACKLARLEKERYQNIRRAVVCIQQLWRAKINSRNQRNNYIQFRKCAVLIQQKWRAKVQTRKACENYRILKRNTIFIQKQWRAKVENRNIRIAYIKLRKSIIFVQKLWRCKVLSRKEQKKYQELKLTIVYVQRRWRNLKLCKETRQVYCQYKKAAICIQRRWKANKLMRNEVQQYTSLRNATIIIQRQFRAIIEMKVQRSNYLTKKNAVLKIQKWYRSCIETRQERTKYLLTKKIVQDLQKYARGYVIRRKYANYFTQEAREQRKIDKEMNKAATVVQSFWRGYKSRCAENPIFKKIREKCIKAHADALFENTLQFKCKVALQTITHEGSTLFHINHALEDIDYSTRRCKNICVTMAKVLPDQLYILLISTGRSLPEMNICISSINILISFNKLKETKDCSFMPKYVEKLITLMMHWCDKESQLFPRLCTLFWLFAHTPQWRRFISNLININHIFEKIRMLVARKENMVKRQCIKETSVFTTHKNLPRPSLTPDWGLDYANNPFAFNNSVHALSSLTTILSI